MGDPNTYNASMESIKPAAQRAFEAPPTPVIIKSPVLEFHDMHWKVQSDMNGWMTIDESIRKSRAKWYADLLTPVKNPEAEEMRLADVETYRMRSDYLHRILLGIFYMESAHPHGSRDVAVIITNSLFPKGEK
jgi:hypothetical protein